MNTNQESGNDPQDEKPRRMSRWANAKFYECQHPGVECENEAVVLSPTYPHNCCAQHGKEWGLE